MTTPFNKALRAYCNPSCRSAVEMEEDLHRTAKIKRILKRWIKTKTVQSPRALVNQIVIFFNVFETGFARSQLEEVCGKSLYPQLNSVLLAMGLSMDVVVYDDELRKVIKTVIG